MKVFIKNNFLRVKGRKAKAFTLAEVLITLGVIGVVAAMTLPTLIHNYQKKVWVNQLKKSYSTLEQGFQKMMADEGVDRLSDVSFISNLETDCMYGNNSDECKPFNEGLKRYFKGDWGKFTQKVCNLNNKNECDYNPEDIYLSMPDGAQVGFNYVPTFNSKCQNIKANGGHMCNAVGWLFIDINGPKGPNVYGRDNFAFYISENGKLYGYGSKDAHLFGSSGNISGYAIGKNCTDKNEYGHACTGYIIENGWKMDY